MRGYFLPLDYLNEKSPSPISDQFPLIITPESIRRPERFFDFFSGVQKVNTALKSVKFRSTLFRVLVWLVRALMISIIHKVHQCCFHMKSKNNVFIQTTFNILFYFVTNLIRDKIAAVSSSADIFPVNDNIKIICPRQLLPISPAVCFWVKNSRNLIIGMVGIKGGRIGCSFFSLHSFSFFMNVNLTQLQTFYSDWWILFYNYLLILKYETMGKLNIRRREWGWG